MLHGDGLIRGQFVSIVGEHGSCAFSILTNRDCRFYQSTRSGTGAARKTAMQREIIERAANPCNRKLKILSIFFNHQDLCSTPHRPLHES